MAVSVAVIHIDVSDTPTRSRAIWAVAPSVPISVKGLHSLAALGVPIYWAGEQSGVRYELTKTPDNRVLVRYLPAGEKVGTKTPYLTIGTYPMKNAFAVTSRLSLACAGPIDRLGPSRAGRLNGPGRRRSASDPAR